MRGNYNLKREELLTSYYKETLWSHFLKQREQEMGRNIKPTFINLINKRSTVVTMVPIPVFVGKKREDPK